MADRYKLNQASCAFINIAAWVFYLIPVFFPRLIWLGFAQVLFGMVGQFITHMIITNIKLNLVQPGHGGRRPRARAPRDLISH
nr:MULTISPECIES: hypothetical protein [Dietzia]